MLDIDRDNHTIIISMDIYLAKKVEYALYRYMVDFDDEAEIDPFYEALRKVLNRD